MNKSYPILIIACLYLLAAGAVMAWFLYMVFSSGIELQKRVDMIANKNAKVKMYTGLERVIETSVSEREELATYVLTQGGTSNFLTSIEAVAANVGVSLTTQSLTVVPQKSKFDELSVEFIIAGSEASVSRMLSVLEALPYHSRVQKLAFAKMETGEVRASVGLTVSLAKYE
jgi:hypothetical protein